MGTNYYTPGDPTCDNPDHTSRLHIGKSSAGWKFGFHGIPDLGLTSWQAWREFLADRPVIDEYGQMVSLEDFTRIAERRRVGETERHLICRVEPTPEDIAIGFGGRRPPAGSDYHDSDGHDFNDGEFS